MKKYSIKRYGTTPFYIMAGKVGRKLIETSIEYFTVPQLDEEFKHLQLSEHAMQKVLNDFEFNSVLDIGSGGGEHANIFRNHNKIVTTIDYGKSIYFESNMDKKNTIIADFNTHNFETVFDCIWCSHVLEHQPNPSLFLSKIHSLLPQNGVLAITVPPARNTVLGGHLHNWNAGILLYNLVFAGFDCSLASVLKYGYNISVILNKKDAVLNNLSYDCGDLRKIRRYLPDLNFFETEDDDLFFGKIFKINW